jgi:type I restriction-modification system DNA methylase subunit
MNDIVYTPAKVAEDILRHFCGKYGVSGSVYDPFKGDGAFYSQFEAALPDARWPFFETEINEGTDFFDIKGRYDWIISNPPYSKFTEVLRHSLEIADNIVYLIPVNKITSSAKRVAAIFEWGGIPEIRIYSYKRCNFPFGFALGAVYLKKGYTGDTAWSFGE